MKLGNLRRRPATSNAEEGYFLIVIMIMVTLLAIASLARVQNVATELKRERDEEMIHRGVQYARAVQKFYHKFKTYPVRIEQLENTNNMRFLRKRYKDPITGGDFRLVRESELVFNQSPAGSSVFGNPATGTAAAGPTTGGLTSPIAGGFFGAAGLGTPSGTPGTSGPTSNAPTTSGAMSGATAGSPGSTTQAGSSSQSSSSDKNFGSSGNSFGGGPFIGVASTSKKVSLKEFDGKNHYKDWLFVYVSTLDRPGPDGYTPLIRGPFLRSQMTGGVFGGGAGGLVTAPTSNSPLGSTFGGTAPASSGSATSPK